MATAVGLTMVCVQPRAIAKQHLAVVKIHTAAVLADAVCLAHMLLGRSADLDSLLKKTSRERENREEKLRNLDCISLNEFTEGEAFI